MRRLYPAPEAAGPAGGLGVPTFAPGSQGLEELAEVYAYPESTRAGQPWVRANMVCSVDGAAFHDGQSEQLSSAADMRIFGVLRALADVVIVGAETVRREGYRPARARAVFARRRAELGQRPAPAIAVVTTTANLDFTAPLFTEALVPTVVLAGAQAPAEALRAAMPVADVVIAGPGRGVDLARAVGKLADRGWTRVLTEGGPRLLAQFAAAGVLDELCLSLSPLLTAGRAARITDGPELAAPRRLSLASLLEDDGFLFARYFLR